MLYHGDVCPESVWHREMKWKYYWKHCVATTSAEAATEKSSSIEMNPNLCRWCVITSAK